MRPTESTTVFSHPPEDRGGNDADDLHLNYDVFMTPGIPIVTTDLPPGVREASFQAMPSPDGGDALDRLSFISHNGSIDKALRQAPTHI